MEDKIEANKPSGKDSITNDDNSTSKEEYTLKAEDGINDIDIDANINDAEILDEESIEFDAEISSSIESCLLYVSRFFDLHISKEAVLNGLVGEKDGLSLGQFSQAAERAGIASKFLSIKLEDINATDLPMMAILTSGHAVIITDMVGENDFAIYNPDFGEKEIKINCDSFVDHFSGEVVLLRPIMLVSDATSDLNLSDMRHWFWTPFRDNKSTYINVAIAAAMTNIFGLATSLFIMVVYDRVVPNNATESLVALTIGIGIVIGFDFVIKTLRATFIDNAGRRADMAMGQRIFNQILDMRMEARKGSTGSIANMLREFEVLRDFITSASLVAVVDLPFIIMFIFVINFLAGPLALVPAIVVPVVIFVGLVIQPILANIAEKSFNQAQQKQSVIVETLYGLETIKSIGAAPMMRKRWQDSVAASAEDGKKSRRITQFATNFTGMAQQVTQVLIVFYGVFLIAEGTITMGAMIASVILVGRVVGPLAQLAQTMTRINQSRMAYRAINKFMTAKSERPAGRRFISRPNLNGQIEFKNVSFSYPDQVGNALEGTSFSIRQGEKVAILGRIGSGKSTIAKLLLGLYQPTDGGIFVDGTDIRQIDPADLRRNIGYTQQDVFLFSGSVRQNIAIGGIRPTDEQVTDASVIAGVHDFISQHPNGYDLMLKERGEGLSGGQKQAIAIARSLVSAAPVLVMDEPTSSMDNNTESALLERLKNHSQDKTLVVITHRTSLLALVDRILVLDNGRIVVDCSKEDFYQSQKDAALKLNNEKAAEIAATKSPT